VVTRDGGVVDAARTTTSEVTDQAAEVASTAADAAGQVAQTAADQAKDVVGEARQQAGQLGQEVARQGRHLVEESKDQLHEQARTQTDRIAKSLRDVAEQLTDMVEGRPPESGAVHDYVQQAADKVGEFAQRVDHRGFDGLVQDAERFARRRPGVFLAGAAAIGFGLGRLFRGAKAAESENGNSPSLPTNLDATAQLPSPSPAMVTPIATTTAPGAPATTPVVR
jgi:ElaB/YqjD/DUF883 family membrane-anchored ribosome-binding protein